EVRDATREDLRGCIRMVESYGLSGYYPVIPQDVPSLMRVLAVFKICWEMSEKIRPWDYTDIRQVPFLYEMHRAMGKPFPINICVPQPLTVDEYTLDYLLLMHDAWKKNGDVFLTVGDYPMLGISKPVTSTGCFTMTLANRLALKLLFQAFDPTLELGIGSSAGQPTDLRAVCWAWGSPRGHLYRYLDERFWPLLCGVEDGVYLPTVAHFESSSSAVDEQAALEKMAVGLLAALHGVRFFRGAGSLCVDDLYSPVQFIIDLEIFRYIRETVEAFRPHPDVLALDGLYEVCRDCVRGDDQFISHPDTVSRFRNVLPSLGLIRREKLRAWLAHREVLADRARAEAIERMKAPQTFHLPEDRQKELDRIYARAARTLTE
ncbi:MAG: trimethylamine methyltransferase family protein, partial [Planctomycetota bacterium]